MGQWRKNLNSKSRRRSRKPKPVPLTEAELDMIHATKVKKVLANVERKRH